MKIEPVSADLLIKLALAALAVGAVVYLVRSVGGTLSGALDGITGLPGRAADAVKQMAATGGEAFSAQTIERPASQQDYFGRFQGPLINNSGVEV